MPFSFRIPRSIYDTIFLHSHIRKPDNLSYHNQSSISKNIFASYITIDTFAAMRDITFFRLSF